MYIHKLHLLSGLLLLHKTFKNIFLNGNKAKIKQILDIEKKNN